LTSAFHRDSIRPSERENDQTEGAKINMRALKRREQTSVMLEPDVREEVRKRAYHSRCRQADVINDTLRKAFRLPARSIAEIPDTAQSA
jgi:hypothetical protein